ncbi:MAG: LAGLIDADG family homing endonuclease [Candidatus Micrarchaeia archaeon]
MDNNFLFADLHIHSKYSRAVSMHMDLEHLVQGARQKGLSVLGTGDFTHPKWFHELKKKLVAAEDAPGFFELASESRTRKTDGRVLFMLTCEVATFFSDSKKVRKVHHVLHAPSFEEVQQLNDVFSKRSNLSADGRPMFAKTSSAEMTEKFLECVPKGVLVPAHCLLPSEFLHCNYSLKKIADVKKGDKVLTHKGRWQKVEKVLSRKYSGELIHVVPQYFREGLSTTSEHPFFAVKTIKKCRFTNALCRPVCLSVPSCKKLHFKKYFPQWVQAKDLEIGDVLMFPRQTNVKDCSFLDVSKYLPEYSVKDGFLYLKNSRFKKIPSKIKFNEDFCRLIGYYLAEGYVNSNRDSIAFSFSSKEKEFAEDVCYIIRQYFGLELSKKIKGKSKGIELVFYSQPLARLFRRLFYTDGKARASSKVLPSFMLLLPPKKQAQLLLGWWRGDAGYTASRRLATQFQGICLRLGIIPSIAVDSTREFERRGKHVLSKENRKITAKSDLVVFSNLSFFENNYALLSDSCFKKFKTKRKTRHGWIDEKYAYLPIRRIERKKYKGVVCNLEVETDNSYVAEFAAVHNCWTPWFGVFGSNSGYDSLSEAYEDQSKNIFAIETGMSSDPAMNWRLSFLDNVSLLSNSDSHSPWPWRLGRECNAFRFEEGKLSFDSLFDAVKKKDKRFAFTVEVDPSYGKYHVDGHRNCNFSCTPQESKKLSGICPNCKRPLTIGVLNRVEELADRLEGFQPKNAVPFRTLLPLHELIAAVTGSQLYTKKVSGQGQVLFNAFSNELNILLNVSEQDLARIVDEKLARAIMLNRQGNIFVKPGFDGEYGVAQLEVERNEEKRASSNFNAEQKSLNEFAK